MSEQDIKWGLSTTRCPLCKDVIPSRQARRRIPLYEGSTGEVWGETGVLTFDYGKYRPGAVYRGIRKEWFQEGEEILGVCECVFKAAFEEKCREINMPPGLAGKSFMDFEVSDENEEAYRNCVEFSLSFSTNTTKGIGIYGPTGVGKTHLASAIICQILIDQIKRGEDCSAGFFSVPRLLQELRWHRTKDDVQEEQEIFWQLSDKEVVILDDLGMDKLSDQQGGQLFLVVNERIIKEKPLIATTNIDPRRLDQVLGERVADRLLEACSWYQIQGLSRRGRDI